MTAMMGPEIVDTLMERLEEQHKADVAALRRLRSMLESPAARTKFRSALSGETHHEILLNLMQRESARAWSPAELSAMSGISQSAIRTVMYGNPDDFEKDPHSPSPARARWRLRSAEAAMST